MLNKNIKDWLESLKTTGKPTVDEAIAIVGHIFPLLSEFKTTIQDPGWHAEGDVHIHTDMVLSELYHIFDNKEFEPSPQNRQTLILAALLHDIAKPFTTYTCEETGRVKASKHEFAGRNLLIYPLLELDLDPVAYIDILNLVGLHQKPKLLVIQEKPNYEYLALNREIGYELIYWLEVADIRGRISEDLEEQLMYLDEFKKISSELLANPYTYALSEKTRSSRGNVGYKESVGRYLLNTGQVASMEDAYWKLYDKSRAFPSVVILCGPSGSGKSSHVAEQYGPWDLISVDSIRKEISKETSNSKLISGRVQHTSTERLRVLLAKNARIVFDATNLTKARRDKIIDICKAYGALVLLTVVLTPRSILEAQNQNRTEAIPAEGIQSQIDSFQFPSVSESHIVSYRIRNNYNTETTDVIFQ